MKNTGNIGQSNLQYQQSNSACNGVNIDYTVHLNVIITELLFVK